MAKVIVSLSAITTVALDGASDPRSSWGGGIVHITNSRRCPPLGTNIETFFLRSAV
jgi:hypothetical protein